MKIRAENLAQGLERKLHGCYLISGDEPLLTDEAANSIRRAAKKQGFEERQVFHADSIDWEGLINEGQAMSLFAARRVIEVRIPNSRPGDKGSKALVSFCESIPDDILLLVITGKLDRNQQRSKWVTTLENTGAHIQVWPVEQKHMPGWLMQRLKAKGIEADRDAVALLAERVEGNLLAAKQEIDKLGLLIDGKTADGRVNAEKMANLVVNSARYDVFDLIDRCLAGNTAEALITLQGLKEEGTEASLILWTLTKEVRQLVQIHEACAQGQTLEGAIRSSGVWQKRQPLVHKAVRRTSPELSNQLLQLCRQIDQAIKSNFHGDPWLKFKSLVLNLSGSSSIAMLADV